MTISKGLIIIQPMADANKGVKDIMWTVGRLLGKGKACEVWEVQNQFEKVFAMKCIHKRRIERCPNGRIGAMNELKLHRLLLHPFICQYEDFFDDEEYIYLILERCKRFNLGHLIRNREKLSELEAQIVGK